MLFIIAILALLSLASAAPTSTVSSSAPCTALVENEAWIITNLTSFEAASGHDGSFVSFHFCDTNRGLELDAECSRTVSAGESCIDPDNYYACEGNQVRFIYSGTSLRIERSYVDDCLGPYPYNSAIAYGQENTDAANTTSATGSTCYQGEMLIKITEES